VTALRSLGGVAIAIAIAWAWLTWIHDPAVRRTARDAARLDSVTVAAQRDSAVAVARDSTARADSIVRARELAAAHQATVRVAQVANALVPRVRAAVVDSMQPVFDSLVNAKDSTIAATARERDLEHDRWVKALADLSYQRDSVVPALRRDLHAAVDLAAAALRRANRKWRLGLGLGYGATASDGRVYAGPTVAAGVTWTP